MNTRWHFLALWIGLTSCCAAFALYWQWSATVAVFERDVSTLHRIVSQRVDQHDAHMTALSALVASGDGPPEAPLKAVAANIVQFYPRIVAIDIVALRPEVTLLSTSRSDVAGAPVARIADAARRSSARTELIAIPEISGRYFLVKLVPTRDTLRYVASLEIDTKRLIETDTGAGFSHIALLIEPAGHASYASPRPPDHVPYGRVRLTAERALPSPSQPLLLLTTRDVSLPAIFPWFGMVVAALVISGILYLLRAIILARQATRDAVRKAAASAQEARLAHATRINALGELSLAIAHELAQPIAALLSQSQAGLRMLQSDNIDRTAINGVLAANARLAKRAGDLLTRLRDWISIDPPALELVNINRLISEIAAVNEADLRHRGIELRLELVEATALASADSIGVEQIVQNLITNARDASLAGTTIAIATFASADRVGFTVTDEGRGIAAELRDRLFEPFASSKSDGMGLGLSICRRLVEKFGGEISSANRDDGRSGTVMTVLLSPCRIGTHPQGGNIRDPDLPDR